MSQVEFRECICGTIYHGTRPYKDHPNWMDYRLPGSLEIHDHCIDCDADLMYVTDSYDALPPSNSALPAVEPYSSYGVYASYYDNIYGDDSYYEDSYYYWSPPPIAQRGCHATTSQPRIYHQP